MKAEDVRYRSVSLMCARIMARRYFCDIGDLTKNWRQRDCAQAHTSCTVCWRHCVLTNWRKVTYPQNKKYGLYDVSEITTRKENFKELLLTKTPTTPTEYYIPGTYRYQVHTPYSFMFHHLTSSSSCETILKQS